MKITGLEHLTDFNRILRAAVKRGPVLVCYLDGLGWYGYEEAVRKNMAPFIRAHFFMNPMKTVSPPFTNPAMATMLTGVLPEVHGVVSRKQHRSQVPTIFEKLTEAVIVEGDSVILQTEVAQRLHTEAEDGNVDYSVYVDGLACMEDKPPLLLLHFHGIDDAGHSYGPYAAETMKKIREIDSYIETLAAHWQGEVFLISDHGLHNAPEPDAGGDHGKDTAEDQTIIFGWCNVQYSAFPKEIPVYGLLEMLALEGTVSQAVFTGADGYACACGAGDLKKESNAHLKVSVGITLSEDTSRLAFPLEPIARRWCKDVEEIRIHVKI